MSVQLMDIADKSRLDLAMRAYTVACARMEALEDEAVATFREYQAARQRLHEEHGITADKELSAGIAAAFATYKQDIARAEGREIAQTDA